MFKLVRLSIESLEQWLPKNQASKAILELKGYLFSKTARQTLTLYASQILLILLGIVTSSLNTRILGPKGYGILAFFGTITGFSALFFRFGLFDSGGLLLAEERERSKERELIGALALIGLGVGLSFSLFIFASSFFIDRIFHTNIDHILRILSPLVVVMPFQLLIPQIGRGTNKITHLAWFNVLPKGLYIVGLLVLLFLFHVNVTMLISLNLLVTIIAVVTVINSFEPLFSNLKINFKRIWMKTKEYGIHVCWGEIANQSTYKLDGIFISYFVNTTQLGFYSLANTIASPLAMLSQSLSTSLFKGFADKERIPKRVIQLNFLWLFAGVIGLVALGRYIVILLFSEKFLPVVPLILPLALAAFFQGMYQPYAFLAAKGKGKWIRNVAFAEGGFNIVGNLILVYMYGAMGAAIASAAARLIHFLGLTYYYIQYRREVQHAR